MSAPDIQLLSVEGAAGRPLRLVGHKGADAIVPGNSIESFHAAARAGVSTIEFDVLWTAEGDPSLPEAERAPLRVAHDLGDAASRAAPTLDEALDALLEPALSHLEFDLDLKRAGREDEVAAAVRDRGLLDRAMFSTMEFESVHALKTIEPRLRRGLTFPKTGRAWDRKPWARPAVAAALELMRRRLPGQARSRLTELDTYATWVFHRLITPELARTTAELGIELIAWTVDDLPTMRRLIEIGVDGICTNDPRLFAEL